METLAVCLCLTFGTAGVAKENKQLMEQTQYAELK